ncbi:glycoside hydrolase family 2 protein [Subtercola boreus]|uniref:glycoside hydrolase family 2 protein n=1 Tax=Subtercola boreus TaxID=120213 RepID=UPI00319E7BC1
MFDRSITVPYPPESPASGIGDTSYHPVVWYRRAVSKADLTRAGHSEEKSRVILHFGAVDWVAHVWLNEQFLGTHEGGQSAFSFDITDSLSPEGENTLIVRAFDDPHDVSIPRGKQDWLESPHSIWYHRTTGIWQPVWLEAVPPLHIDELSWQSDLPAASVSLELSFSIQPKDDTWATIRLQFGDEPLAEARFRVSQQTAQLQLTLDRQRNGQHYEELLWDPEHPRLIDATIILTHGDERVDTVSSYFGLRSVATSRRRFLLNDRPLYLRSVLSQNYWPESHLAAPSPEALRREVELIKELGFNTARIHQKAEDPRFLFWADRLGLLIWGETASAYDFNPRAVVSLTTEWMSLIRRDRSHPSIVVWVPFNESWGLQHIAHSPQQQAFSRSLTDLTRAIDPTRPVISNDGWEHTSSDIWTIHDYDTDPTTIINRYASDSSVQAVLEGFGPNGRRVSVTQLDHEQPIMLTEFGGVSYIEEPIAGAWGYSTAHNAPEFETKVVELICAAQQSPILSGFCYTQLTDTGQETNGLLRADRTPKIPIDKLRATIQNR